MAFVCLIILDRSPYRDLFAFSSSRNLRLGKREQRRPEKRVTGKEEETFSGLALRQNSPKECEKSSSDTWSQLGGVISQERLVLRRVRRLGKL